MKINKYKLTLPSTEQEFLVYSDKDDAKIPEDISEITLIKEGITKKELDEVEAFIPFYSFNDFMTMFLPKRRKRTRDKVLMDAGVISWANLETAYYEVRHMRSNYSKKERELIVEKYSEIINEL